MLCTTVFVVVVVVVIVVIPTLSINIKAQCPLTAGESTLDLRRGQTVKRRRHFECVKRNEGSYLMRNGAIQKLRIIIVIIVVVAVVVVFGCCGFFIIKLLLSSLLLQSATEDL